MAIVAYDRAFESVSDGDFLALDVVRSRGDGDDETYTGELRFDTMHSHKFSTLFGLSASRENGATRGSARAAESGHQLRRAEGRYLRRVRHGSGASLPMGASPGVRYDKEDREQDIRTRCRRCPASSFPSAHARSTLRRWSRACR